MNLIAQTLAAPFPFLQLTLKVTLLLSLFLILWLAFRKQSAAFRHSILVTALFSIPCLFVAQLLVPSQSIAVLERTSVTNFVEAVEYSAIAEDPASSHLLASTESTHDTHSVTPDGSAVIHLRQPSGVSLFSFRNLVLGIWATGVLALIARFSIAWMIVWRDVRRSPKLRNEDLDPETRRLIESFTSPTCKFRIHREAGQMPLCFGIFRYTILLPCEFFDWEFEDQQSVVLHESAHAHRRDCLVNFVAHFENAILWFHPLSWTLLRYLKSESEMACDDWAIAKGADNIEYASALFDVTMSTRRKSTVAVVSVSMADCSPLERRMQSILSTSVPRKPISILAHFSVALLSLAATTGLAGFHLDSTVAQSLGRLAAPTIEHHIKLANGEVLTGEIEGNLKLETSFGNARLNFAKVRTVNRLVDGKHEILTDDDTVLTGIIRQNKFPVTGIDSRNRIAVSEFKTITTIGHAKLLPGSITSGFLKDKISYNIRVPEKYDSSKAYPAIVFLHPANSNTLSMIEEFANSLPAISDRHLLIGINGEKRSSKVDSGFNYTYIDFAGRSRYGGFPGTDRQSPALVTESITELKYRIPISKTYLIGKGSGAFLAFSVMMNYAEMIDGVITIDGGLLVQCVPEAYQNEALIAAQRSTPLCMLHLDIEGEPKDAYTTTAHKAFEKAGFPKLKYKTIYKPKEIPKPYEWVIDWFESEENQ